MKKTIYKHLFLLLAIILAGTGHAFAETVDGYLRGDANGDGYVNVTDAAVIISKYHNISDPACPINADVNGDGYINVTDAAVIITIYHYGSINANGTIEDWTEGNTPDELETQPLGEDEDEDNNYGD